MKKNVFIEGLRDGVPIGLAYFAVSFSLGIAAKKAGLSIFQGFIASLLTSASAGEYAGFNVIAEGGTYLSMMLITVVASARYLLMSCALSQKLHPDMPFYHRLFMGFYITDELFGITMARPGFANPKYTYGAIVVAIPLWASGTALGILMGNVLPARIVSALGVALFGMFLAIVIPPAKENRIIMAIVVISFLCSGIFAYLPLFNGISSSLKIIILTVLISLVFAVLYPVEEEVENE